MGAVKRSVVIAVLAMAVGVTTEGVFVAEPRVAHAAPLGIEEPNAAAEAAAKPLPVPREEPAAEPAGLSPELLADPAFVDADGPREPADPSVPPRLGDLADLRDPLPDSEFNAAVEQAQATGEPVELEAQTTETTISRVHPDGRVQVQSAAGPVRAEVDGEWVDVNTTLEVTEEGVQPVAVTGEITFSAGGDGPMAVLGDGGDNRFSLAWPAELPEPELSGDTATYREVMPGVDLVLTATRTGFQQHLVVNERPSRATLEALSSLEFPLASDGATVEEGDGGELQVTDASGDVVGNAAAPVMWDARTDPVTGDPAVIEEIGLQLAEPTESGTDATLVLTPPTEFLTDPATVYPVTIDPTQTIGALGDTFVQSSFLNSPQGGSTELRAGSYDGGATRALSLLRFDVRPALNRQVQSATLRLFETWSPSCSPRWMDIRDADDFDPNTVTWGDRPWVNWAPGGIVANANVAFGYGGCPANWVNLDLTGWLRNYADMGNG